MWRQRGIGRRHAGRCCGLDAHRYGRHVQQLEAAGPEAAGCAELGNAEAVIGVEGEREGDARRKGGGVGIGQAAQRVDGAGDQGAEFLRVGAARFVHHPGVDADEAGAGEGAEAGERVSEAGECVIQRGGERTGASKGAEWIEIEGELQGAKVGGTFGPCREKTRRDEAGLVDWIQRNRSDAGIDAVERGLQVGEAEDLDARFACWVERQFD